MTKRRNIMRSLFMKKISIDDALYERAKAKIVMEEDSVNKMYLCPAGYRTIGIGHNLDVNPISDEAIDVIFRDDLNKVVEQLDEYFAWWRQKPTTVQVVLLDFVFNVGIGTARKFKHTMGMMERGEYKSASYALLQSLYAKQVPNRAKRNAVLLRSVEDEVL